MILGSTQAHILGGATLNARFLTNGTPSSNFSPDGITWYSNSATTQWFAAGYGNNRYVALNQALQGYYSSDGHIWTGVALPSNRPWRDVVYASGKYVAVGDGNTGNQGSIYSSDGINWYNGNLGTAGVSWTNVAYGAGKFVTVRYNVFGGSNSFAYSSDGISWTLSTLPSTQGWGIIRFGAGKFVAGDVGQAFTYTSNIFAHSSNGTSWTQSTFPAVASQECLAFGNNLFVMLCNDGYSFTSSNGTSWALRTIPVRAWNSIEYGVGKFVAISSTETMYSSDGITWSTPTPLPNGGANNLTTTG